MRVVIFTGGKLRRGKFVNDALNSADMVIAADGGAKTAVEFKVFPSVVIGDFDSLDKATKNNLAAKGTRFIAHDSDKDQTDTELAIAYAVKNGATGIAVLGGIEGDRIDHILANVFIGIGSKAPVKLVNGDTQARVVEGPSNLTLTGSAGDLVSLIPLTPQATGIKTSGLQYPLRGEALRMNRSRGVSNVMTRKKVSIDLKRGVLLLVQTACKE